MSDKENHIILRKDIVEKIKVKIFEKERRSFQLCSEEDENLDKILRKLISFRSFTFKNSITNSIADGDKSCYSYYVNFNNLWNNIKMEFLFDVSEEELFYIKLKFC